MSCRAHFMKSLLLTAAAIASAAQAQINMGMLGDSLTDDYLGGSARVNNNLAALSWGQILADTRGSAFNFGAYKAVGDTWDNVRYSGYEYNWATSGAAASNNTRLTVTGLPFPVSVTSSGASYLNTQATGLAQHINQGRVDTAFVGIGSNDYFYREYRFDFSGNYTLNPNAVIDNDDAVDIANSILAGVDTLLASGSVDVLLALIPNGTAGGASPATLASINAANQILMNGAAARGIATVDLWGWTADAGRVNLDGSVNVGDLVIQLGTEATAADISASGDGPCNSSGLCALDSHANNLIAEDGIHPNTLIQALIANQVITALNTHYGHNIALLSDSEMLALVGVNEVPVPAAAWLFGSALMGLGGLIRQRTRS